MKIFEHKPIVAQRSDEDTKYIVSKALVLGEIKHLENRIKSDNYKAKTLEEIFNTIKECSKYSERTYHI